MSDAWTASRLLELSGQFQKSAIIAAAVDLEVFDPLGDRARTADELAQATRADRRGITILLDALVAMRLLDKQHDRYTMPTDVAALLTAGGPHSVLAMMQHRANCLRAWSVLAETIRLGRPGDRRPSVRGREADYAAFIEAMDNINRATAGPLVQALAGKLGQQKFDHVLDIGGASGTWLIAWLNAYPLARGTLFDLPVVMPMAGRRLREAGLRDRVSLAGGDFMADALSVGADLAWLSAIAHQNARPRNRRLYSSIFQALRPGGLLLVRDHVMADSHTEPVSGAMFAVNMLSATPAGGTYCLDEFAEDLSSAGFTDVKLLHEHDGMLAVVSARKPA